MRKLLTFLSMGAVVASAYAGDMAITGTTDENNPKYLGDFTFATSDSLLWKGIGSGDDAELPVDAYLCVDAGKTYEASYIKISGTNGDNANLNLIFGNGSTLNLANSNSLRYNGYAINMNFYTAEGATATLNVGGIQFKDGNALSVVSDKNGVKRNVFFGDGLTINSTGTVEVEGSADNGSLVIASDVNVGGNMSLKGANVTITETAKITVAGKSTLSGNVVIDGSYIGTGEFNTLSGGGTITVNGTLKSNSYFSGGVNNPTTFIVNNGGLISIKHKFGVHSGSTLTAKTGSTVNVGEFAVGTNDTEIAGGSLVVEEGANFVSNGNVTLFEGSSTTINGNFTVTKGQFLLEKDDSTKDGAVVIANPTLTIGSKAVLKLNSMRTRASTVTFTSGSKTYIDASAYMPDGRAVLILAGGGHKIEQGALLDIKGMTDKTVAKIYSSLQVDGTLNVSGGSYFAVSNLYLNSSNVSFTNTHLAMGENGDLLGGYIHIQKNVDLSGSALLVNKMNDEKERTNNLYLSENVTFNIASLGFYQQDVENVLTINLASGSKLILEDLIFTGTIGSFNYGTPDDQDTIIINNFAEGAIAIKNYNNAIDDAVLDRIVVDGIDQLFWVKGENGYYWLSAVAVPEPAEWAMILGGLALALAIYRRRK